MLFTCCEKRGSTRYWTDFFFRGNYKAPWNRLKMARESNGRTCTNGDCYRRAACKGNLRAAWKTQIAGLEGETLASVVLKPPDRFWINVASRAIVKVSSTYFSHLVLCCAISHRNCVRVAPLLLFVSASLMLPQSVARCSQNGWLVFYCLCAGGRML
jgi:hypothetical protein